MTSEYSRLRSGSRRGPAAETSPRRSRRRPQRGYDAAVTIPDPAALDAAIGDVDWTALPPGVVRDTVRAPSGPLARLRMSASGHGGPRGRIVLVPGSTGSKEDFLLMMPLLARAGYDVEAFDMAGQYESWQAGPERLDPPEAHYTDRLYVDDLLAVLATGPTPAHLMGYSYAATIAELVAVERPELVASLTLLSAPTLPGRTFRNFRVLGPLSLLVPGRVLGRLMVAALRLSFSPARPRRARFIRERFLLTRTDSVADITQSMTRTPRLDGPLRATGVPVLVAAGTHDIWTPRAHRAHARRLGARFRLFRSGHAVCETAPHQLSAALLEFLAQA